MKRRAVFSVVGLAASVLASGSVWAQAYPNRPIKLQVPFRTGWHHGHRGTGHC